MIALGGIVLDGFDDWKRKMRFYLTYCNKGRFFGESKFKLEKELLLKRLESLTVREIPAFCSDFIKFCGKWEIPLVPDLIPKDGDLRRWEAYDGMGNKGSG